MDKMRAAYFRGKYKEYSIVIEWETGRLQMPYAELLTCSKKRLRKIIHFAAKHGGWKVIKNREEDKDE